MTNAPPLRYLRDLTQRYAADAIPWRRIEAALACWVRKEAVLKAAGLGLAVDPRTVSVTVSAAVSKPPFSNVVETA